MLGDPKTAKGAIHWALLGLGAAVVALMVGAIFPSLIPLSAKTTHL